jgi:thiamine-monophosphate kinase
LRRLGEVGEHAWIEKSLRAVLGTPRDRRVVVGPGDDAAAVRVRSGLLLLLTTDCLVEGVHFRRGWAPPAALGRRAFAVNASDLAAMGGTPAFALLALEAPARLPAAELDAIVRGFVRAARREGAALVGGNLAAGPHLAITVALVGMSGPRTVTRAGARPGDGVYLTGTVGGAGLAVRRLAAGGRGRLPVPASRVRAGRLLAGVAGAMIDVSDGLLQDAAHLARASGVALEIEAGRVPVARACRRALGARALGFALGAGEDYELLASVPARRERALAGLARRLGCPLTRIGRVVAGAPGVRVLDAAGRPLAPAGAGFDHFRRAARRWR